jgi:hypothetical protein
MGFMRRVRGGGPVPAWAGFLSGSEYGRFRKLVDDWLQTHSQGFRDTGDGGLEVDLGAGQPTVIGLTNLAQKCHISAPEDWPEIVAGHLDSVFNPGIETDPEFESIKCLVKVRIYPDDFAVTLPDREVLLVKRPLAPGAVAALAIDYPKTVATVSSELVAKWAVPVDELFELGLANVRAQDRPGVQRRPLDGGAKITILVGDSFFTATWVLMLDEFVTPATPHGAVVAIPNRHIILILPIVDLGVVAGIQTLLGLAGRMYGDGPGPITSNIYWRHAGELGLLPTRLADDAVFFEPPLAFIDVLNQLHKPPAA